jgi:CBS domain-containing protein
MQNLQARDIMSPAVHHVSPQLHLVDLDADLTAHRISGAPVIERGAVVGIVSRSDIESALSRERTRSAAVATWYFDTDHPDAHPASLLDPTDSALESLRKLQVCDVMTREVISVSSVDSVIRVATLMSERRIHRVLVVDDGKLTGIVSALDVVSAVAKTG